MIAAFRARLWPRRAAGGSNVPLRPNRSPWFDATVMKKPAIAKTTILVIGDEILMRVMVAEALQAEGYTVIEAVNAAEALTVLRSRLHVDLVLADLRMPGSDCAALVRLIRGESPVTKVVIASAEQPNDTLRTILDGYVPKPFTPSAIRRYVRELVQPCRPLGTCSE
jgi:two-component system, response regulator PdtaR